MRRVLGNKVTPSFAATLYQPRQAQARENVTVESLKIQIFYRENRGERTDTDATERIV